MFVFIMMRCNKPVASTVLACYTETLPVCGNIFLKKVKLYLCVTHTSSQAATGTVRSDTYHINYLTHILYT